MAGWTSVHLDLTVWSHTAFWGPQAGLRNGHFAMRLTRFITFLLALCGCAASLAGPQHQVLLHAAPCTHRAMQQCHDRCHTALMHLQSSSRHLQAIPPYVRGPDYQYFLTVEQRERGLGYLGSRKRLKAVVAKLLKGE